MTAITDEAIAALRAGGLAVLPTDTVYGLACLAASREAAADLYRLKGRDAIQPSAVVFASIEALVGALPELTVGNRAVVEALLPGPFTLVLPNPAGRFAWLNERNPAAVGVRVPDLPAEAAVVVAVVGGVVATSANLPGGPDPCRLAEVPARIRAGVGAAIDGGELPGTPSTVIDLTGPAPSVLREGAGDVAGALERIAAARAIHGTLFEPGGRADLQ